MIIVLSLKGFRVEKSGAISELLSGMAAGTIIAIALNYC